MKSGSVLLAGLCVIAAAAVGRVRMQIARHPRSSLEHTADLWDTAGRNSSKYQITRVASDSTTAQVTCMPEAIGAMPGKSCSPPYHIHTFQRETFVVHKGTFTFLVDGRQTTLQAGAAPFIVESPVPHSWWNAEPGQEGMLEFSFTPGGKIREFFRTIMGLGQDWGNVGLVTPFQLLSTFHAADYVPADIPTPVWKVLSWCMPALEWTLGIQPFYSEYTDAQKL